MRPSLRGAVAVASLCTTLLNAQEMPAPGYSESIEVRIIDLDVVVTDKAGRPITGLTRDDFELLEDGKPVEIRYFTAVAGPPPSAPGTPAAQSVERPAEQIPVTWIVFIDQTNMPPGPRNHTLRSLRAFLEKSLAPGDRVMVANNDGMAMRVPLNLATDRAALAATLEKLQKERVQPSSEHHQASQVLHDIRELVYANVSGDSRSVASDSRNFGYLADHLGAQINMVISADAHRTRNSIRSMGALVDALGAVEGRLALVYAGAGFNPLPGQELTDAWKTAFPGQAAGNSAPDPSREQQYIQKELDQLYSNLSATRVAVYTIYAANPSIAGSAQDGGGNVMNNSRGIAGDRARNLEASLARDMAQRTGGLFFTANPELAGQLDAVRVDLTSYYSLGYVPSGRQGKARDVKVRVRAEGARVRHRSIVRERTPEEEASRAAVAAVVAPRTTAVARRVAVPASPPPAPSHTAPVDPVASANPLGVKVEDVRPRPDGWSKDHVLPFDLKLGSVTFVPKGRVNRAEFVLHFALVEPDGTVWPLESRDHALEIPADEVARTPEESTSLVWHLDLAPLKVPQVVPVKKKGMKLVVTVDDRGSNTRSVVAVPVGEPAGRWFPESAR